MKEKFWIESVVLFLLALIPIGNIVSLFIEIPVAVAVILAVLNVCLFLLVALAVAAFVARLRKYLDIKASDES